MRQPLLLFLLLSFPSFVMAQSNETIRSGRPGQAIGPFTVGSGYLQVQSGLDFSSSSGTEKVSSNVLNTVFRYGPTETFELSAVVDYSSVKITEPTHTDLDGISGVQLGFRFNVIDKPQGLIPALGVQGRFKLDSVGGDFAAEHTAPIFTLIAVHKLSDSFDWFNNLILSYSGNDSTPKHGYVSNLSFPVGGSWGGFLEIFGSEQSGVNKFYADTGVSYLYNKDLQFDLSGGYGKNQGLKESFVSFGISWRTQALSGSLLIDPQ